MRRMLNTVFNFNVDNGALVRRGSIQFPQKTKILQTPACLAYSVRGSVPHLVADNLKLLPVDMVHIALEHFVEQKEPASFNYPHGLHKYVNMPDQLLFCDVRDPSKFAPTAANTEKFVTVDTYGGVRRVTTEMWAKAMEAYRPDWCASPADVIKAGEPVKPKRIQKSVDRTLRWLDECLIKAKEIDLPLFAPVVGFNSEEERVRSATGTAERDVHGFVLNAYELEEEKMAILLQTTIDHLPNDKPRLAYGLSTPEKILLGISSGIDLFDNSYAFQMTERGRAITFQFGAESEKTEKTLNLWQKKQSQAFEPIDPTCQCYACKTPHTKAYIHHLLNAHEMLGPLLLMSHNVYQLDQFMIAIRKSMDENRFKEDMATFIAKYNQHTEVGGEIGDQDETDATPLGEHVKSKRQRFL